MKCPKCNNPLEADWVVCPWCRKSIVRKKSTQTRSHGNGIGTAYRRGDTWTSKVIVDWKLVKDDDGNVIKKLPVSRTKGGFKTKAKALAYCEYLKQNGVSKKAPTLSHYYDVYINGKGSKLSHDKQVAYGIAYNKLEKFHHVPIDKLNVKMLQDTINEKCSTFYPARDMKVLLHHLFKLADADGFASYKLPELLELPKLEEKERKIFSKEQQQALYVETLMPKSEATKRGAAAAIIMIQTGMMPGELMNLTIEMINFERHEIVGAGLKTNVRRKNAIVFPDELSWLFHELIGERTSGKLFPEREAVLYSEFYAALKECGMDKSYKPYCCRHTTATTLTVDENLPDPVVKRIMRWSTTKMVDRYAHPDDEDAHEAIETLAMENKF